MQPAAQQARTHGCDSAVQHPGQRVSIAAIQCVSELQIASRRCIHLDAIIMRLDRHAVQMGQGAALGFPGIAEQTAGGSNFQCRGIAKAGQIMGAELLA